MTQQLVVDEARRLQALHAYGVLDTPPEEVFDRLTHLAARLCGVPMATVTLVDEHRQWFKSRVGIAMDETPRDIAFCAHGIGQAEPTVVPDATHDERFVDNPLVVNEPKLRFYACVPLVTPQGLAIGTLAVMDTRPRSLEPLQIEALQALAEQVMMQFELRLRQQALERLTQEREWMNAAFVRQAETLQIAGRMARVGGWIIEVGAAELIWSDTVAAIHGLEAGRTVTLEEALGFYPEPWRSQLVGLIRRCLRDGLPFDEEMQIERAGGERAWVRLMGQPVRNGGETVTRINGAMQDITQRKLAEAQLARSEANFRQLANAMPIVVWTARPDGTIDFINKSLYDFTTEEAVRAYGINWVLTLHPDDRDRVTAQWQHCVQSGEPYRVEYRLRHRAADKEQAASYRWYLSQAEPERDAQGHIVRWYGSNIDIDATKAAEADLASLADRLSSTLEIITDTFIRLDSDWRVTYMNAAAERSTGRQRAEVLGRVFWEVFPLAVGTLFERHYRQAMEECRPLAFEAYGATVQQWVDVRVHPVDGGLVIYSHDITARRMAEEQAERDRESRAALVRIQQEVALADLPLAELLALMCRRTMEVTGASGGEVEFIEGETLVTQASVGTSARPVGAAIQLQHSVGGLAVRSGQAQLCTDALTDERVDQAVARRFGVRSIVVAPLRTAQGIIGSLRVTHHEPGRFGQRELDHVQILVESMGATVQRQRIAERLKASEAQYRLLFEHNPYPMWVTHVKDLRILAVNPAAVRHYGYSEAEFLARNVRDLWPPEEREFFESTIHLPLGSEGRFTLNSRHVRRDGSVIDVEVTANEIEFSGQAARLCLVADVTERRRVERDLLRVSRAQRMLSACNEALIRIEDEAELLQRICQITVDIGGYRMAWVGFARDDANSTVEPAAHAGVENGFLQQFHVSWAEDHPHGRGAVGRTVRSRCLTIVQEVGTSATTMPWTKLELANGYRSIISLPLNARAQAHAFGVLCLFGGEKLQVGAEEEALLQELADDLAFGITHLRAQVEQRRIQDAVLKVSAAVSAASGEAFFGQLVRNMTDALGASTGFVARYLPEQPGRARALAAVVQGAMVTHLEFDLAGTPCERLLEHGTFVATDGVADAFPDNVSLRRNNAQAYVGRRLDNAQGEPIGLLFVTYAEPLRARDFVVNTLQIFAARAAAELERLDSDRRIQDQAALLDKARDAILVRDMDHRIRYWNLGAVRMYGWTAEEALGQRASDLLYQDPGIYDDAVNQLMSQGEWVGEIVQKRKDGSLMPVEGRWTVVYDEKGQAQSVLAINTDITERKATEREIQKLAFFDPLTGLPNRQLLMDRLQHALLTCQRQRGGGALLFIDLDNFKTLNDTLGHDKGDQLLQQVAQRLRDSVREVDTVARLGGDEFVILLENLSPVPQDIAVQARAVGDKVLAAMASPYRLGAYEHQCSSSIGVAPFTHEHGGSGELLRQADIAMYQAKAAGRNTLRFFDPGLESAVKARAALEADLRQALVHREFLLHYQPQVDGAGRLLGVEALLRWRHPVRGLVSPAEFVSLAEETGLIVPMGGWVLQTACALLAQWGRESELIDAMRGVRLSVNVSARQFHHPDFVEQVIEVLQRTGADPTRLKLELTESLLVEDTDDTIAKMAALKGLGVGFSLDDFGTGYSSLSYLKRLPLEELKIDRSFVRDVLTDVNDSAIARTIIALGHTLGLEVIAEGVETEAQRAFLQQHGCNAFQGYLFSRPVPAEELPAFSRKLLESPPRRM